MLDAGITFLLFVGGASVSVFLVIMLYAISLEVHERRAVKVQRRAIRIDAEYEVDRRYLVKARQEVWRRAQREGWNVRLSTTYRVLHEMVERERASR